MNPNEFRKTLVQAGSPILEALSVLDSTEYQIALVVDEGGVLKGTITDGDIRRAILKGIPTSDPVELVLNENPVVATRDMSIEEIHDLMDEKYVKQIPVVDRDKKVIGLELSRQMFPSRKDMDVVLMVGGLGTRLMPLTENCPKPMLKVGGRPILERIITNFKKQGFSRFHLAVNYMAHMVEDHFGDGSKWGVQINYLREEQSFGTAGALSLLPNTPKKPFVVMNGDLLTSVDFNQLVDFHYQTDSVLTMCVREYNFQVPYGVVKLEGSSIVDIEEKPEKRFFVNSGIYVLNPEALELVPKEKKMDMPTLFLLSKQKGKKVSGFPLREYWLDIGQMEDFKRAEKDLPIHFEN